MTEDLQALIDKGRRSLAAARRDYDAGDYDLAVSRGYYAMFHLAVAALKIKGGEYRRHATVVAAFRDQFASEGVFAPELHVAFGRAFGERTISDYRYDQRVTQATARQVLDDASRFVEEVEAYLRRSAGA